MADYNQTYNNTVGTADAYTKTLYRTGTRQSPDAILSLQGLTGVVADVQDDPDSSDSNWLDRT